MAAASSSTSRSLLLLFVVVAVISASPTTLAGAGRSAHLTAGFIRVRTESQFVVQKPYDVPLGERYQQFGSVHRMWVFATDKPISASHPGGARTEIKVDVRTISTQRSIDKK